MNVTLTVEQIETSILLDHFTKRQLAAKSGYSPDWWPEMVVKELVDNAIDACEASEVAPIIDLNVTPKSIEVTDNGPGIATDTIEGAIDYSKRVSTKSRRIAPTRGSQGEALKQCLAVPYVLDGKEGRAEIGTNGTTHLITVRTNEVAGRPEIRLAHGAPFAKNGTSVRIWWPESASVTLDDPHCRFLQIAAGYALFNPHTTVRLDSPQGWVDLPATDAKWGKWLPYWRPSVHWWTDDDLAAYIAPLIAKDVRRGEARTLREFVAMFDGLSSSAKQKAVTSELGLSRARLDALANGAGELDRELISKLRQVMVAASRPIKPQRLGVIGKEHFVHRFQTLNADPDTFRYQRKMDTEHGLPYVIEAAFACSTDDYHQVVGGINWSPGVRTLPLEQIGTQDETVDWILADSFCGAEEPVILAVHVAVPKVWWTDQGKTQATFSGQLGDDIVKTIKTVTKDWTKQRRAEERNARTVARRIERLAKRSRSEEMSVKDAVLKCLPAAVSVVSKEGEHHVPKRNLFYALRKAIQAYTSRQLTTGNCEKILKQYEEQHGPIPGLVCDPRGYLIEPHTGRIVPLGTLAVDEYLPPRHLYHSIIYIEKKGFQHILKSSRLAEKYDIAIVCAEGYAVRAARTLLHTAQRDREMTIACVHDADPAGYEILRTLREATKRTDFEIHVIDFGPRIEEALHLGLEPETFLRKCKLSAKLRSALTDIEREMFAGDPLPRTKSGKPCYKCRRIELNDLAKDPDRFIEWLEGKIIEHGMGHKLIPDEDIIVKKAKEVRDERLHQCIGSQIDAVVKTSEICVAVTGSVARKIDLSDVCNELRVWAQDLPPETWTDCVAQSIERQIAGVNVQLESRVRAELAKRM